MVEKQRVPGTSRFSRMIWANIGAPLLASIILLVTSIVLLRIGVPLVRMNLETNGGWVLRAFQIGGFLPPVIFAVILCRRTAAAGLSMTEEKRHWIAFFISVNWAIIGISSPLYFFFHGLLTPAGTIDHIAVHWTGALLAYEMNLTIMRSAALEKAGPDFDETLHLQRILSVLYLLILVQILHAAGALALSAVSTPLRMVLLVVLLAAAGYAQRAHLKTRRSGSTDLSEEAGRGSSVKDRDITVLIVEDSPTQLALQRTILKDLGCEVHFADSGAQGLMQAGLHDLDLILLNVDLPDMDGRIVARRMRDAGILVPIVAVTGLHGVDMEKSCKESGMTSVLPKPVDAMTMSGVLTSHCGYLAAHEDQSRKTYL